MKKIILTTLVCFLISGIAKPQDEGFDNIGRFGTHCRNWALVQKNNKFGFIDANGKVIVPIKFDNPEKIKIDN